MIRTNESTHYNANLTYHQGFRPSLCAIHERPLPKFPENTHTKNKSFNFAPHTFLNIAKILLAFLPVSFYQSLRLSHFHPHRAEPWILTIKKLFKHICINCNIPMTKSSCAASSSHLETIDLSAELALSHGFFAPSRGEKYTTGKSRGSRLLTHTHRHTSFSHLWHSDHFGCSMMKNLDHP